MSLLLLIAAQAVTIDTVRPDRFYVAGIQQGMTIAEYNSLIANGRYQSKPVGPDTYWATIDNQSIFVTFCEGKIFRALASYSSVDWVRSMATLEELGFQWLKPYPIPDNENPSSGAVLISSITPANYTYTIAPLIKAFVMGRSDLPTFQLRFEDAKSSCTPR